MIWPPKLQRTRTLLQRHSGEERNSGEELPEKLGGGGCAARFPKPLPYFRPKSVIFPYPISDVIKNLIPYFRPKALEPSAWPERLTSCYGMYAVVGVNIKREMVLSQNDEEVANSSKKYTQFKTRLQKPYPISDENGRIDTLFQTKTACSQIKVSLQLSKWGIRWPLSGDCIAGSFFNEKTKTGNS